MGESGKKIFVSIPLEKHFEKVFSRYRDMNGKVPYLRWTPIRKLHLTVLYIGMVRDQIVPLIIDALGDVMKEQDAFALTFEKIAYAPPDKVADMVWAYFLESEHLNRFARMVYTRLEETGNVPADSFRNGRNSILPHVTLARFRDTSVRDLVDLKRTELEGHKLLIEEAELLESKSGGEYATLAAWKLGIGE